LQTKSDNIPDDKSKSVSKTQDVEDKIAALVAYRMAKGLCRRCGEKWFKGHTCATSMQLNAIQEVWDLIESNSESIQDSYASQGPTEQAFMVLHIAAISGEVAPKTLKIKGVIQGMEMLILIDSGSSHSFISDHVAAELVGVTAATTPIQVKVANGGILQSVSEMFNAEWFIQEHQF
jgi:hypothetical protein